MLDSLEQPACCRIFCFLASTLISISVCVMLLLDAVAMSNTTIIRDALSVVISGCHRDCTQAPASGIGALAVASGPIAQLPDCQSEALPILKSFIKARQHYGDLRMSFSAVPLLRKLGTSLVCCGRQSSVLLALYSTVDTQHCTVANSPLVKARRTTEGKSPEGQTEQKRGRG